MRARRSGENSPEHFFVSPRMRLARNNQEPKALQERMFRGCGPMQRRVTDHARTECDRLRPALQRSCDLCWRSQPPGYRHWLTRTSLQSYGTVIFGATGRHIHGDGDFDCVAAGPPPHASGVGIAELELACGHPTASRTMAATRAREQGARSMRSGSRGQPTSDDDGKGAQLAVGARVRVATATDAESCGVVVEDFGELSGHAVCIGTSEIVGAARRWAVVLDDGALIFADNEQIAVE